MSGMLDIKLLQKMDDRNIAIKAEICSEQNEESKPRPALSWTYFMQMMRPLGREHQ